MPNLPLILASSSPGRQGLLRDAAIEIDQIIPADIDETPKKKEKFPLLVKRLAEEKAIVVAEKFSSGIIIGADTIVTCKGKLLEKASTDEDVRNYLKLSSNARNKVITAVCVIKKENNLITAKRIKLVSSIIKFKAMSEIEIDEYVLSKEGIGKAGGVGLIGRSFSFIKWLKGSVSAVIGLPICETKNLLRSVNYDLQSPRED